MHEKIGSLFEAIDSDNKEVQAIAFITLNELTQDRITWTYDVWDILVGWLSSDNPHLRSVGAQFLANLAQSDPEDRISTIFNKIANVCCDSKFVTARHSLLNLYRIGLVDGKHLDMVLAFYQQRFNDISGQKTTY